MIGVVGGGVSGLFLGHELVRSGNDVTVWEATGRLGGVVSSEDYAGLVLERGPQRMRLTPQVKQLIEEVGLQEEVVMGPSHLPLLVYSRGKLRKAPLTLKQLISTDLLPLPSKLRVLAEVLTAGAKAEETVGKFLRRKFGIVAYENFLGPLYGGLYGSDPDRMLVKSALVGRLKEAGIGRSIVWDLWGRMGRSRTPPPCSFKTGLGALPDALGKKLGSRIELDRSVRSVHRSEKGWRVVFEGGTESLVDAVVFACPAKQAGSIIKDECPKEATLWQQMNYNELAICHMKSDLELEGLGYQVGLSETLETRGVTCNHSLFGRKGLYTAFLGGMKNPKLVESSDQDIASVATSEFEQVTGFKAVSLEVSRTKIPAWDLSWREHDTVKLPDGLFVCSSYAGRPGLQGRIQQAQALSKNLRSFLLK